MLKHSKIINPVVFPGLIRDNNLLKKVENYFNLPENTILSSSRKREIIMPRQVLIWLEQKEFTITNTDPNNKGYSYIARKYGLTRYSIMHSIQAVKNDLHNPRFKKMIYDIQLEIFGKIKYVK